VDGDEKTSRSAVPDKALRATARRDRGALCRPYPQEPREAKPFTRVFSAGDVVDGEPQAFAQAQAASVDELDGSAVTAQADDVDEIDDLLSSEHGGQAIVILGSDLREDGPLGTLQQLDKEHASGGRGLTNGFGTPPLFELHEKEVVAQLGFSDQSGIAFKMFVNEPELAVIGVAGAIGVVMQREELGKAPHGIEGMGVIDWIGVIASRGAND